jgi:hypothetical protein
MIGDGVPSTSQRRVAGRFTNTDAIVTCSLLLISAGTVKREQSWLDSFIINVIYRFLLKSFRKKIVRYVMARKVSHI